jgi:hypothetical protein
MPPRRFPDRPEPRDAAEWAARLRTLARDTLDLTAECGRLDFVFQRDFEKLREQIPRDELLDVLARANVALGWAPSALRHFARTIEGATERIKAEKFGGPRLAPEDWLRVQLDRLGAGDAS